MRIVDEPAYVLHTRAWRETSLLVEVLSEHHGQERKYERQQTGSRESIFKGHQLLLRVHIFTSSTRRFCWRPSGVSFVVAALLVP